MSDYLVNIGNTHTQVSTADLSSLRKVPTADFVSYVKANLDVADVLYCASVVKDVSAKLSELSNKTSFLCWQDIDIDFSKVDPKTIGADRLANIAATRKVFDNRLVFDCGTCITAEVISSAGVFEGGFIMPGRAMSRKSLNTFTSQLPEVPLKDEYKLLGKNTVEAIQTGVDSMSGLAVERYTAELQKIYGELKVVLTGGDAEFFSKFIPCDYVIEPLLTLKGLQEIFINQS